ncbi:MAG: cytochrome b/b6 domain-containing protein [Anaerolineales bacterium]|nr:cytochrome b/b6 domain-containing protein [Anaerolineales bacterium]
MTQPTPARYRSLQVTLHWLTVILVFAAFVLGKTMTRLPNEDAAKLTPLAIHMLLGITTLAVIVVRFVVRIRSPRPAHASTGNAFLDWLGAIVHYALYLFVFLIAFSGLSLSVQAGLPPIVFGGVGSLPTDFFDFAARALHGFIAPGLFLLILLHIGAAFYHQLFLKDKLFARMWYGK